MRILVTGGAGFIGSHIVESYLDLGHEVTVADNLSTGKLENIDQDRCEFVQLDISNRDHVEYLREFGPFDIINHQAAQMSVSDSVKDPYNDIRVNIIGTVNLLDILGPTCKKFIFASSGGTVYGEHDTPRHENSPLEPVSPYGISKLACEKYVSMYSKRFSFDHTILRYSNVYGPRQNPHGEAGVIAIFIENIINGKVCRINGDGKYHRDYIYVDDIVKANVAALDPGFNGIHNVSIGYTMTTNEIWEHISQNRRISFLNPKVESGPHREGDIRFSCCIPSDIPGLILGTLFGDGLKKTVDWYFSTAPTERTT